MNHDLLLYDGAESVACTRCGANPGIRCVNPHTHTPMRLPCRDRTKAAEAAALAAAQAAGMSDEEAPF